MPYVIDFNEERVNKEMEKESIPFIKQLLDKLEKNVALLESAKANNDPRLFNELKKTSFDIHKEIGNLIK